MRLITYQSCSGPMLGVLNGEWVRPLPGMEMLALIEQGETGLAQAQGFDGDRAGIEHADPAGADPGAAAQHHVPGDELRRPRRREPARQEPADQDARGAGVLHQGDHHGQRTVWGYPLRSRRDGKTGLGGGAGGGHRQAGQKYPPRPGIRLRLRLHRAERP